MIRAILTDLGNVTCLFDRGRQVTNFHRLCPDVGREHVAQVIRGLAGQERLRAFECGELTDAAYKRGVEKALRPNLHLPDEVFWKAHTDMFTPNAPVLALWLKIQREHPMVKLIAVSDTDPRTLEHLVRLCHLVEFRGAATSYMVQARKPDPRIFHHAIKNACCSAEECLFVDDILANVRGAQTCGIVGHHFTGLAALQDTVYSLGLL